MAHIKVLAAVFLLLLVDPATAQKKPSIRFDPAKEALFVIGISPSYQTFFFSGTIENGRFKSFLFTPKRFSGLPFEGYAVGRAKADEVVALTEVDVNFQGFSLRYYPCGEIRTATFQAKAGQVVYLGDISFLTSDGGVKMAYGENFDAARQFMARNYPEFASALVQGKFELLPTTRACKD